MQRREVTVETQLSEAHAAREAAEAQQRRVTEAAEILAEKERLLKSRCGGRGHVCKCTRLLPRSSLQTHAVVQARIPCSAQQVTVNSAALPGKRRCRARSATCVSGRLPSAAPSSAWPTSHGAWRRTSTSCRPPPRQAWAPGPAWRALARPLVAEGAPLPTAQRQRLDLVVHSAEGSSQPPHSPPPLTAAAPVGGWALHARTPSPPRPPFPPPPARPTLASQTLTLPHSRRWGLVGAEGNRSTQLSNRC